METQTELDPLGLNIDTNAVDTSRPLVSDGTYACRVSKAEVSPNKAGTGRNLIVEFTTTVPATSTAALAEGRSNDIAPGWKFTRYYPLQQSDNPKAPDFRVDPIKLQDACLGTKQGTRPAFNPNDFLGKEVLIVVKVRKLKMVTDSDGNAVPEAGQIPSNDVSAVLPLPTEHVTL